MSLHLFVFLLVVCLLLSLALLWRLGWFPLPPSSSQGAAKRTMLTRLLKPRAPDDCPACRLASAPASAGVPTPVPVRPWREVKSRRGAPKRIETEGYACQNRQCSYFGNTDAREHALVGDGKHGRAEQIQTFRCQACRVTFSARRNTPLYRLKTPSHQVAMVLSELAEGLDLSAAESVFGYCQATITRWLTRAGEYAQSFHEHVFCLLQLPYVQLDELRTRLRNHTQVQWLWLAIDPRTKILPVLLLGPRTQHMAHVLIHALRESLASGCVPLFTSDGLNLYFYALTAHFGQWREAARRGRNILRWQVAEGLIYGQVKKCYRRRKLVRVTHVMRLGTEADLKAALQSLGFSGRLNTAFIERVNLTVRHGIAALACRTWATAQQTPQLLVHLEWWRAYYHFVRPHESLRVRLEKQREREGKRLAQRYRQRAPAMVAGRTHRRWTAREVLSYPLPKKVSARDAHKPEGLFHVVGRWVKIPAEELEGSLTLGRAGLSGLPHHLKPARSGSVKSWSIYPPCPMEAPKSTTYAKETLQHESRKKGLSEHIEHMWRNYCEKTVRHMIIMRYNESPRKIFSLSINEQHVRHNALFPMFILPGPLFQRSIRR